MPNLVIVAIPREEDPVWKYSSEKKPHCTLLFLGEDQSKSMEIAAYLQHAVNITDRGPFGLSVDHRGTLGVDEADVLFFRKDWAYKDLASFRTILLKDKNIRDAYDSVEQFPEWNPHLTMGYPQTPAKKDDRDYPGFHWVEFDRIALWTGNYEGPEFRLEYNYDAPLEVAMSTTAQKGEEFVQHHGVKGMKWGVRKARSAGRAVRGVDSQNRSRLHPDFQKEEGRNTGHDVLNTLAGVVVPVYGPLTIPSQVRLVRKGVRQLKADKGTRQDMKFERRSRDHRTMIEIHNKAVGDLNREQKRINEKYKGVNLTDPKNAAKSRKYHQETVDMMAKVYQKHANATTSKTGKLQYDVELRGNDTIALKTKKIQHAVGDDTTEIIMKFVKGDNGQVIGVKLDELKQGEEMVDALIHYGVKGMKWGVHRSRPDRVAVTTAQGGTAVRARAKVITAGGEGHKAHSDAIKVAGKKAVLKKSGTAALSNKDLQDIIERARLEGQAREAVQSKGQKTVSKFLGQQTRSTANQAGQQFLQEQLKKKK